MLHYQAVPAEALRLLKKLQRLPEFSGLRLVGGTGLALHIGHRRSVDIDLFGAIDADRYKISELINNMGEAMLIKQSDNILIYSLNSIKLDIVK